MGSWGAGIPGRGNSRAKATERKQIQSIQKQQGGGHAATQQEARPPWRPGRGERSHCRALGGGVPCSVDTSKGSGKKNERHGSFIKKNCLHHTLSLQSQVNQEKGPWPGQRGHLKENSTTHRREALPASDAREMPHQVPTRQ